MRRPILILGMYTLLYCLLVSISIAAPKEGTGKTSNLNNLISTATLSPGAECANGGSIIMVGLDDNRNGILEEIEVGQTEYICNGTDGQNSPTLIDMDQYVSTFSQRFYNSKNTGNGYSTITISSEKIDESTSIKTWIYDDGTKEDYRNIEDENGRYRTEFKLYHLDSITNEYVLDRTKTYTPPFKSWPKGQIHPNQTWGGIFTIEQVPYAEPINKWRDYSIVGYEDVTVPYGTFVNALKVRRMRINGGLSNYWYAVGYGLVKSENIYSNTGYMEVIELVSASN
jgi:hypothetical protein